MGKAWANQSTAQAVPPLTCDHPQQSEPSQINPFILPNEDHLQKGAETSPRSPSHEYSS